MSEKVKSFTKNGFLVGIVIQLILPSFLPELETQSKKFLGITTVLFALNQIACIMTKSGIWEIIRDKMVINTEVNFNIEGIKQIEEFHFDPVQKIKNN